MKTPFLCSGIMADGEILGEKPAVIVDRLGSSLDSAIFHRPNLCMYVCMPLSLSIKMRITLSRVIQVKNVGRGSKPGV